jgi:tetratricopeptide (TPR) repeat protein
LCTAIYYTISTLNVPSQLLDWPLLALAVSGVYTNVILGIHAKTLNRKSQLAIEYAYQLQNHSPDVWVFWVHASSAARFKEGYRRIAERAKIPGWDRPDSDIIPVVHNWLCDEANGRWLMIVDNADDATIFSGQLSSKNINDEDSTAARTKSFSQFLPQSQQGSILITSRSREVAFQITGDTRDIIPVCPMDEDHALKLLRKKLQTNFDEDDGKTLLQVLDYMPLAITQAAAFISQRTPRVTVSKYLHDLKKSDTERLWLLNKNIIDTRRDGNSSNSIIATWQISFENICKERPSAARLLSLMSLFDRQGIPKSLLEHRYQESDDSDEAVEDFDEDVYTLCNYYLIGTNIDSTEFEMHRLVQFSTKTWLEIRGELEKWKERFIKVMDEKFPVGRYENWTICRKLFPHAEIALECRPANGKFQTQWASIVFKAGWFADEVGNYNTAEKMKIQAVNAYEALGLDDTMTLTSKNNLAETYRKQGRWKEAEELDVQVMEMRKRVLSAEHLDTLTNMANLASTFWNQG